MQCLTGLLKQLCTQSSESRIQVFTQCSGAGVKTSKELKEVCRKEVGRARTFVLARIRSDSGFRHELVRGDFTAAPRVASDDLIRSRWCPVQRGGALERVVRGRELSRKQDPLTVIPAFATARQQARGRKSSRRRPQCQAGSARGASGNGARCSQRMEAATSASHLSLHDGGGRRKSDTQCLQGPTVRRRTTQHVHVSTYVVYA